MNCAFHKCYSGALVFISPQMYLIISGLAISEKETCPNRHTLSVLEYITAYRNSEFWLLYEINARRAKLRFLSS